MEMELIGLDEISGKKERQQKRAEKKAQGDVQRKARAQL
jgi:hypothetical protein